MKILLTSTSFQDTPGAHQEKLASANFDVDTLRGPVSEDVLLPIIAKYDAVVCGDDEYTRDVIKLGSEGKLKVISKYGVGLDKIDLDAAQEFNIPVTNCPGVNHVTVAEHVLALILTYYKNIHLEYNVTKSGGWFRHIGRELHGKKLGILGLGKIGKQLALVATGIGMKVSAYDIFLDQDYCESNRIEIAKCLEGLVKDIDILSLHLPLTKESEGMVNTKVLKHAQKKITIVNTSRALVVDQPSLYRALDDQSIEAYLVDVLEEEPMKADHPLLKYPNVLITPHIGSRTHESVQRQGLMAVDNLFKTLNVS
jgi:D-3-phosphoglycerate dehydrogenase / 2-oxoglutarate reductase